MAFHPSFLVPKRSLGTVGAKLCFAPASVRETEFPPERSQTEFGNEENKFIPYNPLLKSFSPREER